MDSKSIKHTYLFFTFFLVFLFSLTICVHGTLTQTWQFSADTNRWTNNTTQDVWYLSGYTFTKVAALQTPSGGFTENWVFNPADGRWEQGATSWGVLALGSWKEFNGNATWTHIAPTTNNPRGTWQRVGHTTTWSYNESSQQWFESSTGNNKFFPPFLPSPVIVQHQEILSAYDHLTTREIPHESTNIHFADDFEELVCNYTTGTWSWNAPSYAPTGNINSEWKDNVPFTGPGGSDFSERWALDVSETPSLGTACTHASASLLNGETIYYNATTNSWQYAEGNAPHVWLFDPLTNEWINKATQARYEYDTRDRSWIQTDKALPIAQWRSQYDATHGWVWNDTTHNVLWKYDAGHWRNITTNISYEASQEKLLDSEGSLWSYSSGVWTKDGTIETNALFPLLPPNVAGQIGRIQLEGFILAQTHATTGASYVASTLSQLASFTTALTLRGSALASAMTPLASSSEIVVTQLSNWHTKYLQLLNPFTSNSDTFVPTTDAIFDTWNPVGWRFFEPGKGVVFFQAKGSEKLTIGLSSTPSTNGSAEYTLITQATETTTTLSDSALITTLSTNPCLEADEYFHDYWLSYHNGNISFGTGALAHNNIVWSIDLNEITTLANTNNLSTVQYVSFGKQSAAPFEFKNIRTLPYDSAHAFTDARNVYTRSFDEAIIGTWQAAIDSVKPAINDFFSQETGEDRRKTCKLIATAINAYATAAQATKTATDSHGYESSGALKSPLSRGKFDAIYDELINSLSFAQNYQSVISDTKSITAEINALYTLIPTNPSPDAFENTLSASRAIITEKCAHSLSLLNNSIANATLFVATNNNASESIINAFKEEAGIIAAKQKSLLAFETYLRFKYYEFIAGSFSNPTTAQLGDMNTAQTAYQNAYNTLRTELTSDLSEGDTTLFAAVIGSTWFLSTLSEDDIRTTTTAKLSTNVDLHTLPTTGDSYTNTLTGSAAVLNGQTIIASSISTIIPILVLTENPNTDQAKAPTIEELIDTGAVETTKTSNDTTDITDQKVSATTGTTDNLNNIIVSDEATVQEVVIDTEDKAASYLRVYAKDATVGLGRTNLSINSGKAMTVLGSSELVPDGDGVVYVYSDIHILPPTSSSEDTRTNPFSAGPNFGLATTDTRCIGTFPIADRGKHKLEFRAPGQTHSIVVGSGVELDLTNFGKGDTSNGQRIIFGKDVSLIMMPGATIRFPYLEPANADRAPILEFAGPNARLIFVEKQTNETQSYATNAKDFSDKIRSKIRGVGKLRFSGTDSRMEILRGALVGIEADHISPRTDITIELTGERSRIDIGNNSIAGGALQIGNTQKGGYDRKRPDEYPNNDSNSLIGDSENPFEVRINQVDFTVIINGLNAQLHIDREGFLGFGVGIVNKNGSKPNGSATSAAIDPATDQSGTAYGAWTTQTLYDVGIINISLFNGSISHQSFGLGNSKNASLWAIGPVHPQGFYLFRFQKNLPRPILGGGNIMYMHPLNENEVAEQTQIPLCLWETATTTYTGTSTDNGIHSLLAPGIVIANRKQESPTSLGTYSYGAGRVTDSGGLYTFLGNQPDFYRLLSMQDFKQDGSYVAAQRVGNEISVGYVSNNTISFKAVKLQDIYSSSLESQPLETIGYTGCFQALDGNIPPQRFAQLS